MRRPAGFLNMMRIGVTALRFLVLSLPFGGGSIILSTTMQALRHSRYTLAVNILRQLVLITGLFALLSALFHDLDRLWAAVPVSELISFLIALLLERALLRHLRQESGQS